MSTLKSKLLKLRRMHNFTQDEIAKKVGVSQNSYFKWEAGISNPKTVNLQKIANFYKIGVLELLSDSQNANTKTVEVSMGSFAKVLQNQANMKKTFKELFAKVLQNQANMKETYDTQLKNLFVKIEKMIALAA